MVSTRGIKLKFTDNERVLCYEPDPTKAKVLYDSKVLDVVVRKDHKGKKTVEYLIHFQGWNSSWDRYVSEEYVLKDTAENRQLQKDLADKSQLQIGAYLYRKDRKKRKTSERPQLSDEGSSGSPTRMDNEYGPCASSSSEDDSSGEDELVPIELTVELKEFLEEDFNLITARGKLVSLPASPNVVQILEAYWQQYFNGQVYESDKQQGRQRQAFNNSSKKRIEDVQRNLSVCSEVLDGIRIYFDFMVKDHILYASERNQIETGPAVYTGTVIKEEPISGKNDFGDYYAYSNNNSMDEDTSEQRTSRKRTLRSNRSSDGQTNGSFYADGETKAKTSSSLDNEPNGDSAPLVTHSNTWKLLPEHVYFQHPPPPCLVYGAVHLTRLLVKLPEFLSATNVEEFKLKTLLQHLDMFIDFLTDHREWYGEKFYVDK